jgi:hypothetical protein
MADLEERERLATAKLVLAGTSLAIGVPLALLVVSRLCTCLPVWAYLIVGILGLVLYPILGSLAASISEWLSRAVPDHKPWSEVKKIYTAAFWPVTLPFWLLAGLLFWSINLVYPLPSAKS